MAYKNNQGGGMDRVNPIQVQKFLKKVNYPASKMDIINTARQEGADQNVIDTLEKIPDRTYDGPVGISQEIGKFE